jgi:hypothetical protein
MRPGEGVHHRAPARDTGHGGTPERLPPITEALRAASAHIDRHELADAERVLRPLLDRTDLPPDTYARAQLEWGWLMGATQRYDDAAEALARAAGSGDPDLRSEALLEAGIVDRYRGRLDEAETHLRAAGEIAEGRDDLLRLGQTLAQRAQVAHLGGHFPAARDLLDRLAATLDRCPPHERTIQLRADWCQQSAVSARVANDFDRARTLLAEARDRYASIGRRIGVANAGRELGAVLEQVGDEAAARESYAAAFAAYLRAGRGLGAAHVARRLGQMDVVAAADDPAVGARARRRFAQALRLGGSEPSNEALTRIFLAQLDRLSGDLDAARAQLENLPFDAGLNARLLSQAALEFGMIARARGDRAEAIGFFRQALQPLDEESDPGSASIAHYQLAYDLILDDRVSEARDHALAAFALREQAGRRLRDAADRESYYRSHREAYALALHCSARAGDGRSAFAVATAARAEAVAAFVRDGSRVSPEVRDLVGRITLAARAADGGTVLPALYRELERRTSTELRRSLTAAPADLATTVAALPRGGHALLLDALEDDESICTRVWLPPDGVPVVDEVELTAAVRGFLDDYHAASPEAATRQQHEELAALGEAIVPPGLRAQLTGDGAPPLVVATGNVLGPVPVTAVRVGGRYLAELARVVVVPAIALMTSLRTRPPRPGSGVAAYLDPDLPGTGRERTALTDAFPAARLLRRDEVRGVLTDGADLAAMLFSTHGTAETGLGQALLLGEDDPLTAAELLVARLPDAVLMPACWSGRTSLRAGAEPLGLPTAALLAGARWVLAGTVNIAATTTATLLGRFYRRLAEGSAPVDALRHVQLDYLRRRPHTAPHTWAGLTIVGDGFTEGRWCR